MSNPILSAAPIIGKGTLGHAATDHVPRRKPWPSIKKGCRLHATTCDPETKASGQANFAQANSQFKLPSPSVSRRFHLLRLFLATN